MISQIILLGTLLAGSITDLKKREVPDLLNYSLIVMALLVASITSLYYGSFLPLKTTLLGMFIALVFGNILFYSGQWGGGDAKMIIGAGGFIGVGTHEVLSLNVFYYFLLYSFIIAAITGMAWMILMSIKNKEAFLKEYEKIKKSRNNFLFKIAYLPLVVITLLLMYFNPVKSVNPLIFLLLVLIGFAYYLSVFIKATEEVAFKKLIPVNELTEGDWILSEHGIEIDNTGITFEQIDILKKKGVKKVLVKEGIPFVPSFFLAYLVLLI